MAKFIVVYHAPGDAVEQMEKATPEEMKEGMKPWMAWADSCGEALVDLGTPLGGGLRVTTDGVLPSERAVAGYSVIEAESMDQAVELLKGHPHLNWTDGCEIEVHQSFPMVIE